ncbi:MAG: hypothetical protein QOF33_2845 [Thermomicrobiales bacterium]|nr:hypothetical protein [Thermomicrobiales bacterium]
MADDVSTLVMMVRRAVSTNTVQQHIRSTFEKTGVRSRRDLVGTVFFTHRDPRVNDNEYRAHRPPAPLRPIARDLRRLAPASFRPVQAVHVSDLDLFWLARLAYASRRTATNETKAAATALQVAGIKGKVAGCPDFGLCWPCSS